MYTKLKVPSAQLRYFYNIATMELSSKDFSQRKTNKETRELTFKSILHSGEL